MKYLAIKDLEDIVWGATLLGSGGGGSPENGLQLVHEIAKVTDKVPLVGPEEIQDNDYIATVAGMGAPKALKEKGFGAEALYAFDGLVKLYEMSGIKIKYLMPVETGGFNSVSPIYVAAYRKIPMVDVDGAGGRAVPELNTLLYFLYKIPTAPLVLANKNGDTVAIWLKDPLDAKTAEDIGRGVTVAFGMLSGVAGWVVTGWQAKKYMEPNSLTRSLEVGKAIREAKEAGKDPAKAVLERVSGYELIRGTITKIEIRTVAGFDFGRTVIEGEGEYSGRKLIIDFKNENMIAWYGEGEPAAMVPDLVCLMSADGTPLTNADTKEGMKITVLGFPASERWRKAPNFFDAWRHILEKMDYTGDYVPIEKLVKK